MAITSTSSSSEGLAALVGQAEMQKQLSNLNIQAAQITLDQLSEMVITQMQDFQTQQLKGIFGISLPPSKTPDFSTADMEKIINGEIGQG